MDSNESTHQLILQDCKQRINDTQHPPYTDYKPTGLANVWQNNYEISDQIETTLRNSATTQDIRLDMQKKYAWTDNVVDSVDWIILSRSLQHFPNDSRMAAC
jgi:hypothetical protein